MLVPVSPPYRPRKRRGRARSAGSAPPPPQALTLVSAVFTNIPARVTLTFDRPVDILGFVGDQVTVKSAPMEARYRGNIPATLVSPAVVLITLAQFAPQLGGGNRLTATAGTGIVAVNDGGTWSGVTDLLMPFP